MSKEGFGPPLFVERMFSETKIKLGPLAPKM